MKTIHYLTTNPGKVDVARLALQGTDYEIISSSIETPEIQSTDVEEVASFSARWAAQQLQKPIALTDVGWYFHGLNGFPGPFIKYVNQYFTVEDYTRLFEGLVNRKVEIKECLAYCEPGKDPITVTSSLFGSLAITPGTPSNISAINQFFIPNGFNRTSSEVSHEEITVFWAKTNNWEKLTKLLKDSV